MNILKVYMEVVDIEQKMLDLHSNIDELKQITDNMFILEASINIQKKDKFYPIKGDELSTILRQILYDKRYSIIIGKNDDIEVSIPNRQEYNNISYPANEYVKISEIVFNKMNIDVDNIFSFYWYQVNYAPPEPKINILENSILPDYKMKVWNPQTNYEKYIFAEYKKLDIRKIYDKGSIFAYLDDAVRFIGKMEKYVDRRRVEYEQNQNIIKEKNSQAEKIAESQILYRIILNKIGKNGIIKYRIDDRMTPEEMFEKIEDSALIKQEYQFVIDHNNAIRNNKCPHVAVVRQFCWEPNDKLYEKVKSFISEETSNNGEIICNNCKFSLCCPHRIVLYPLLKSEYEIIYEALLPFIVTHGKFHYCKICNSELLKVVGIDAEKREKNIFGDLGGNIRGFLRLETAKLFNKLTFNIITSRKQWSVECTNATINAVLILDNKFNKRKDDDEVQFKMFSIIAIYVYILINFKKKKITLNHISFETPIKRFAQKLIEIIIADRNIIQANVSQEFIKTRFADCIKLMSNINIIQENDLKIRVVEFLHIYPLYWFLLETKQLIGEIPFVIKGKEREVFQKVVGKDLNDLKSYDQILMVNLKVPDFKTKAEPKIHLYKVFWGGSEIIDLKTDISLLLKRLNAVILDHSGKPVNKIVGGGENLSESFLIGVNGIQKYLNNEEIDPNLVTNYPILPPAQTFLPSKTRRHIFQNIPITQRYDENGFKHEWTIRIFKKDDKLIELSEGSAVGQFIDERCTICKKTRLQTEKLDPVKVKNAIKQRTLYISLLDYYTDRCPLGELHEMQNIENDIKCQKCGITKTLIDNKELPKSAENISKYYEKYKEKFKSQTEKRQDFNPKPIIIEKYNKPKWEFNREIVVLANNKFKINNQQLLMNLGNSHSINRKIKSHNDPRIGKAYSILILVQIQFSQFIYNTAIKLPDWLKAIFDKYEVEKRLELQELENLLPEIKNWEEFKKTRSPEDCHLYLIETFCSWILDIANSKKHSEICLQFAEKLVQQIIKQEKLQTDPQENLNVIGINSIRDVTEDNFDSADHNYGDGVENNNVDQFSIDMDLEDTSTLE